MDDSQGRELTNGIHKSTGSYELVLSPLLLALLGYLLDRWLGTLPLLTVLFALAGLTGACVKIYYRYQSEMDEHEANAPWKQPLRARDTGGTDG